jgi:metal-responsive CopG/Arc/MetJ family transcriptional regulator
MSERPSLLRKQIYLSRDLNRRLHQNAIKFGGSESAIIREALEQYLAQEQRRNTPKEKNPVLQMGGMFEGTPDCREVSTEVDKHLTDLHRGIDQ